LPKIFSQGKNKFSRAEKYFSGIFFRARGKTIAEKIFFITCSDKKFFIDNIFDKIFIDE